MKFKEWNRLAIRANGKRIDYLLLRGDLSFAEIADRRFVSRGYIYNRWKRLTSQKESSK